MMRVAIGAVLLLAMVGCSDAPPTAHDVVECDSAWDEYRPDGCARACVPRPPDITGDSCSILVDGAMVTCLGVVTAADGSRGCCDFEVRPERSEVFIVFTECL